MNYKGLNMELLKDLGLKYPKTSNKRKYRYGLYKCECGNTTEKQIRNVKNGHIKSCGCLHIKSMKKLSKHNLSSTKLYKVWISIKQRCNNPKDKAFKNYGGRGITLSNEWIDDFKAFYDWCLGNDYKEGLSIDRIDNDKGYSPDNCRFTNQLVQNRNTQKLKRTNSSGVKGVWFSKQKNKWIAEIKINYIKIHIGTFKCRFQGAYAYDNYIIENNLEHTKNFS